MNAQEAKERALLAGNTKYKEQYDKVQSCIANAVARGEFFCFYYDALLTTVRVKLGQEGFTVGQTIADGRNDYTTKISW